MASAQDNDCLSPYRKFLLDLSSKLLIDDLEKLKFACKDVVPHGKTEEVTAGFKFFDLLEQNGIISPQNLTRLENMMKAIGRADLALDLNKFMIDDSNEMRLGGDDVPDGQRDEDAPKFSATQQDKGDEVVHDGLADDLEKKACTLSLAMDQPLGTSPGVPAARLSSSKPRLSKPEGQGTVQYVNSLTRKGYSVQIVGGKHFKTPEGEFVKLKSGTHYEILLKNSRSYACNVDISIDGYDVGGWIMHGGQQFIIERSAYEARKFTFYRVKKHQKKQALIGADLRKMVW